MHKKPTVVVLYGGKSPEHEVSCRSAAFVLKNLDRKKYDVQPVGIDKDGVWHPQDDQAIMKGLDRTVPIHPTRANALPLAKRDVAAAARDLMGCGDVNGPLVVFPVIHGATGEDGLLQGMLEFAEIAYVGPDQLGSSIGMDKLVAKKLAAHAGVPIVPFIEIHRAEWDKSGESLRAKALKELGLPLFVKPARGGSSVGISKVKEAGQLIAACELALQYDSKLLLEKGLSVREIEFAALGDESPEISVAGEVIPHAEFYDYEAKYLKAEAATVSVPAKLEADKVKEGQALARRVFVAMELFGMARMDFFIEKTTGQYYFNEANTAPGMTQISQYPMLWKASGVDGPELLDRLIALALKRRERQGNLKTSYL